MSMGNPSGGKSGGGSGGGGGAAPAVNTTLTSGGVAVGKLTSEERFAIDHYSGFGYLSINRSLRGEQASNAEIKEQVAQLDAAISKGTLAAETTLYRGTAARFLGDLTPGTVLKDKAFLSTSRSMKAADYFGHDAMIRITAPRGIRAADVSHHAGGHEQEILLGRNTKLKVTGVSTSGGRTVVDVRVIR
jgi:hypothetical protein